MILLVEFEFSRVWRSLKSKFPPYQSQIHGGILIVDFNSDPDYYYSDSTLDVSYFYSRFFLKTMSVLWLYCFRPLKTMWSLTSGHLFSNLCLAPTIGFQ